MDYIDLENLRDNGWKLFYEANTTEKKVFFLFNYIVEAHYIKAKEHVENRRNRRSCLRKIFGKKYCTGYEMTFDDYIPHWLHSHKNEEYMKNGVWEECLKSYEPEESKYLPEGSTIYVI